MSNQILDTMGNLNTINEELERQRLEKERRDREQHKEWARRNADFKPGDVISAVVGPSRKPQAFLVVDVDDHKDWFWTDDIDGVGYFKHTSYRIMNRHVNTFIIHTGRPKTKKTLFYVKT